MAEREGFEPPEGANLQRFSRPPRSTELCHLSVLCSLRSRGGLYRELRFKVQALIAFFLNFYPTTNTLLNLSIEANQTKPSTSYRD